MKIAAAVLAAGGSTRMGRPKQLLRFRGESLVRRAARAALEAGADPVLVVVGDAASTVAGELNEMGVTIVANEQWASGIASSIRAAVNASAGADALLVLLADQPHVGARELEMLTAALSEGRLIAAASYDGALGAPAIFRAAVFPELLQLTGDRGAKSVLAADPSRVIGVPMEVASTDVDTPEDASRIDAGPAAPAD